MNRKKRISLAIGVVGTLVLAGAVFGGAPVGTATGVVQVVHEQAAPGAAAQPAEPSSGGPSDAIRVHGHWTIQLVNPDGSVTL
jgi:hypothetical protein